MKEDGWRDPLRVSLQWWWNCYYLGSWSGPFSLPAEELKGLTDLRHIGSSRQQTYKWTHTHWGGSDDRETETQKRRQRHTADARNRRAPFFVLSLQCLLMGKLPVAYTLKEGRLMEPYPLCRARTAMWFWIWETTNITPSSHLVRMINSHISKIQRLVVTQGLGAER